MKNYKIDLYTEHACENEEIYDDSRKDSVYKKDSGDYSKIRESDEGGQSSESGEDIEDSEIEKYLQNFSDYDDKFEKVLKRRRKCMSLRVIQLMMIN